MHSPTLPPAVPKATLNKLEREGSVTSASRGIYDAAGLPLTSQRRACALMQTSRSSLFYVPSLPIKNAPVVSAMRRLSGQYPRYGSRRIRVFLGREGMTVGSDKCRHLWAEQGLQVRRKRPRRRMAASRPRPLAPAVANSVWSDDFVFDACANGQQLKCLTVVDEYTREALGWQPSPRRGMGHSKRLC